MTTDTPTTTSPLGPGATADPLHGAVDADLEVCRAGLDDHDLCQLQALYEGEWWSKGRTMAEIGRLLDGSVFACLRERAGGQIAATARVVTDFVTFAVVLDVVVHPVHRGRGLGAAVIDALLADPRLADLHAIGLRCEPALDAFYARWGFKPPVGGRSHRLVKRLRDPLVPEGPS